MALPKQIEFNRPAKYRVVEVLARGACGETVRIRDEDMECDFVAKKYHPLLDESDNPDLYGELLDRFRDEARILFQLNHPNIVRVFNFFDYRDYQTSYIIMEFVAGLDILEYLHSNPANADKVFEGVIDGFTHLQQRGILHRDIRPMNILVDSGSTPKIIDFGFGKKAEFGNPGDEKSISLNWWCDTPPEFEDGVYDFQTEVYFVGKLFQKAVEECNLSDFKYMPLLRTMCEDKRDTRSQSFSDVQRLIFEGKFSELAFSEQEVESYRNFADGLVEVIASIRSDAKFERDTSKLLHQLEVLHRRTMLEEYLAAPHHLARIFVLGSFKYWKKAHMEVASLLRFLELLRGLSEEKRSIVVENLMMRLESIERTEPDLDDEVPF